MHEGTDIEEFDNEKDLIRRTGVINHAEAKRQSETKQSDK